MTTGQAGQESPALERAVSGGGRNLLRRRWGANLFLLLVMVALVVLGYRWTRDDSLAILVDAEGPSERDHAAQFGQWLPARRGDRFLEGDGARTRETSFAHFRLFNGARLLLEPASQIRFQRGAQSQSLGLEIEFGEVNVQSADGTVNIGSEFGPIAIDANTRVRMRRQADRLQLSVELGRIELGEGAQAVTGGQSVALELGGIVIDGPPQPTIEVIPPVPAPEPEKPAGPELVIGDGISVVDLVVQAGESFVVHDPRPPSAIGFGFKGRCPGPGRVSAGAQNTEALEQGNLRFGRGQHTYELRCLAEPELVVAKGRFTILEDAGTRQLPTFTPTASVTTDGRSYTVLYQNRLPKVTVTWPSAPVAPSYTLDIDGRAIESAVPSQTLSALAPGSHRVTFAAATAPPRQSRPTTIQVVYDAQAPAARVAAPAVDFEPSASVTVAGQAQSGWTVAVGDEPLVLDAQQNFSASFPASAAIPIAFSHPKHGTHYYLRRPRGIAP